MREDTFEDELRDVARSVPGWYEAKLQNRVNEGYEVWRDPITGNWKGYRLVIKGTDDHFIIDGRTLIPRLGIY